VLHADERNSDLSDKLGRDVYHYHLHVIYVPVVTKEIKWTKRAGAELAGKVKAVIPQINHTDKWPCVKVGKRYINEYSKLQTRYFEHMRAAGFEDIERGVEGSTAEHLKVLQFKIQQEQKRLDALVQQAAKTEAKLSKTEQALEKKTAQDKRLDEKIAVKTTKAATIAEIDAMGKPGLLGGVHLADDEAAKLKALAKKSITADDRIAATKKKLAAVEEQLAVVENKLRDSQAEARHWHNELTDLKNEVKDYLRFVKNFPARVEEFFTGLRREEQEQQTQQAERQQHKKSYDRGL
jgi:chromosome segregation ATPase